MRGQWTRRKVEKTYRRLRPAPPPPDPFHKAFESACYAPTTSMYFDQFGNVRACCQNTGHLLGNVREQSIREIWESSATRALRDALVADDYSFGCGFCQWQVDQDGDSAFARTFDTSPVNEPDPRWPVRMEFSLSNACNLQCVMCNGDWSSSIRAHREHRAPLPSVYGDRFFAELEEFLPHLQRVNILGGEPFLGKEPLRVLSMLADLTDPPAVAVTTNGTQWSPRIEALLNKLPISFVVSLDGVTKATYEEIRRGADFEVVMTNLDKFRSYADRHDTRVSIAHCLMRPNWHEFADLLRFAEDRGLEVGMNEVLFPVELSLFQLPPAELREIVQYLERDEHGVAASLERLRPVWEGQLYSLKRRAETLESGNVQFIRPWGADQGPNWEQDAITTLTDWVGDTPPTRVEIDRRSDVCRVTGEVDHFLISAGVLDARNADDVTGALSRVMPPPVKRSRPSSSLVHDQVLGEDDGNDPVQARIAWRDIGDQTTLFAAVRNPPPPPGQLEDLARDIRAWSDAGSIVTLTLGADGRVEEVTGNTFAIGLGPAQSIIAKTPDELMASLAALHGRPHQIPGPSNASADVLIRFDSVDPSPTLRVMTDQRSTGAIVIVGARAHTDTGGT